MSKHRKSLLQMDRRTFLGTTAAAGISATSGGLILPGKAHASTPKRGGRLRFATANGSTTDTLDPAGYTDTHMMSIGFGTHGTLTEIDPSGELVGDLAESWEAAPGAKTWTFRIRKGVEFSNGKTLDADDVIASLNHHRGEESKSAAKANVDPINELKKRDSHTIDFVLHEGNADFPFLMADYHLLIMPANDDGTANWQDYIGTGGYTLDEFEPGQRSFLTRNPNFWKPNRAHFDEIELLAISDAAARQNALVTGEVDAIDRVDLKTLHLLDRQRGIDILESTGFQHYTAPMITTNSPYDNNELRLAIKHGIDRDELVQKILKGHGLPAYDSPISPTVPYAADLPARTYDPDKARHHLKKAGYDNIKLDLSAGEAAYAGAIDAAVLMSEQLSKAGIEVNVMREPDDGYWSNVWMKKDWSQCYWGGRPTCDWMFSTAYSEGANWNDSYWSHERFNALLKEGRAELDAGKRADIYNEMQQIVSNEGGVVIWGFVNYVNAVSDRVAHGPVASNWDLDGARIMERWWSA